MLTDALIPANGVFITKQSYPDGYFVADYDAKGFTRPGQRFFPTLAQAQVYAAQLSRRAA